MADKTVSLELKIDASGAAQSVGDLKKSIVELKNQALKAGEDSVIGKQFLKQAGEAKDRLSDLNRQVDNFQDAGAKFGAVSKLVGGLAAGFQAAQGAAALFGSSGEDIQKIMLKVQSATALAQGVQGIAGLGENFKDVGAIIKGPLVGAFTTLRGALIATGIGALAVAVGLLYENFDSVKKVLANIIPESVQKAFGYLKDAIGGAVDKVKEWVGLGEQAKGTGNLFKDAINGLKKPLEESAKSYNNFIEKNKEHYEWLKKLSESGAVGSIGYYNFLLSQSNEQLNKLVPGSAAYNAELQKQLDIQTKLDAAKEIANGINPLPQAEQLPLSGGESPEGKAAVLTQDFLTANLQKGVTKRREILGLDFKQSVQLASQAASALQGLGDAVFANKLAKVKKGGAEEQKIIKQQFEFNKKMQLAGAIIDGAKAVISSLAQSPVAIGPIPNPAGIASLALVAVSTAASIAKIAATKFDSSGGSVTTPSFSAGSLPDVGGAPNLNGNQPTTQLNGNQQDQHSKVYVTETDIKRVTNRVNVIESRATFR